MTNSGQVNIIRITDEDRQHMQVSRQIRYQVFVEEQHVPEELEYDEYESTSHHYLLFADSKGAATCRWRETSGGIKLERFAVLPVHRGKGFGALMLQHLLDEVIPMNRKIYLHAQVQVCDFYSKYGFAKEGERFEEAGIQHFKMSYINRLSDPNNNE